jgi:hypothetical protein
LPAFAEQGKNVLATTPVTSYRELRAAIQSEKDDRIRAHQARVAATRRMSMALAAGQQGATLNLIAQGDSWFDYPLPVPIVDQSDVIAHLKRLPSMAPEVLSLAHHGEAAEDMLGVKKLHELVAQLTDPANGQFDAILFSGGGNDLAGDQFRLWVNEAAAVGSNSADGLNAKRVDCILGVVRAGYEDLMATRDEVAQGVPIFAHSYDFAIPSGIGVACAGPWLRPGLDDRGWADPVAARAIVKALLLQFDSMLEGFAATAANNFCHVRTQATLADGQWANELHPTPAGFATIAAKFVEALRVRFPGRI